MKEFVAEQRMNEKKVDDAIGIVIDVLTSSVMTEEEARQALFEMQRKGICISYSQNMKNILRDIG